MQCGRNVEKHNMKIDREHVKNTFAEYTDSYNSKDPKIKLKIDHTYRVASLCEMIAKDIGLSDDDTDVAWLIGMLHDVGRFEQIKRYGTFDDSKSVDHAGFGADLLFNEKLIESYVPGFYSDGAKQHMSSVTEGEAKQHTSDFENVNIVNNMPKASLVENSKLSDGQIVEIAIRSHSAYKLSASLDERTLMFCNIIRDADKVDIFRVNIDTPAEEIYNVTTEELKNSTVTPEVMQAFDERHAVLRSLKKTAIDNLAGHIALTFELVYPISAKIAMEQGYLAQMMNFESDNETTRQQFAQIRKKIEEYVHDKNTKS